MATENQSLDMLSMEVLSDAAACLKVMAHPVRLRIVDILMQGEFPVREIAEMCDAREHQICEHLRLMQNCGLLSSERRGRTVYYKIESPNLPSLLKCIRENCGARLADECVSEGAME